MKDKLRIVLVTIVLAAFFYVLISTISLRFNNHYRDVKDIEDSCYKYIENTEYYDKDDLFEVSEYPLTHLYLFASYTEFDFEFENSKYIIKINFNGKTGNIKTTDIIKK